MKSKKIPKKGYRVLAIIWALAAASVAVAVVRGLPEFRLSSLCLLAGSVMAAVYFWRAYKAVPQKDRGRDPFDYPPKFNGGTVLFDDDPAPSGCDTNKDSEENDHE